MQTGASTARISVRQGGAVVPIVEHAIHRSPELASRGLLIEQHAIEKSEFPKREPESHILYMHTGASVRADIEGAGVSGRRWLRAGMVWVMPEGSAHAVCFHGKVEGMGLSFTRERLEQLMISAGAEPGHQLVECMIADQPKLEYLMRALWCESQQPAEPGLLAAECIAAAIALTLSQPRIGGRETQRQAASGLTGRQLQMIVSFVEAHISEPIWLQSLADVVGLSSFHFLRAFKRSTGLTPHRYVLEQRIERAKRLLLLRRHTIAEVGAMVGFAHQSHFARAFRSYVGSTPGKFASS